MFLPGEVSSQVLDNLCSDAKLSDEKSAEVIVLTIVRKDRTLGGNATEDS